MSRKKQPTVGPSHRNETGGVEADHWTTEATVTDANTERTPRRRHYQTKRDRRRREELGTRATVTGRTGREEVAPAGTGEKSIAATAIATERSIPGKKEIAEETGIAAESPAQAIPAGDPEGGTGAEDAGGTAGARDTRAILREEVHPAARTATARTRRIPTEERRPDVGRSGERSERPAVETTTQY